jgi:hypothetical protein
MVDLLSLNSPFVAGTRFVFNKAGVSCTIMPYPSDYILKHKPFNGMSLKHRLSTKDSISDIYSYNMLRSTSGLCNTCSIDSDSNIQIVQMTQNEVHNLSELYSIKGIAIIITMTL